MQTRGGGESGTGSVPIRGVATSTAGFIGETERGPTEPCLVTSWAEFRRTFGSYFRVGRVRPYLPYAVAGFFANGGRRVYIARVTREDARPGPVRLPEVERGLASFRELDEIAIVYAPDANAVPGLPRAIISHCESLKRFAILDSDDGVSDTGILKPEDSYPTGYAAFYYPWIRVADPVSGDSRIIPPGGHIAGIYARTDRERGVHEAPAGVPVKGAMGLEFTISGNEQALLNARGVNCIRSFPGRGILVWGSRTLSDDPLWKHVPLRRLLSYLEESIAEGIRWTVFEPNDEKLWARVRAAVTQFLTGAWESGALAGRKPEEAFFVRCDRTTMTEEDRGNGRLICMMGVAPLKPAEFVIFRVVQEAGGSSISE